MTARSDRESDWQNDPSVAAVEDFDWRIATGVYLELDPPGLYPSLIVQSRSRQNDAIMVLQS